MAPPTFDVYKSYFDDPTLSDLTLKLSDRTVHAHRIVLCRASEYFTSLLTGSFQESTSKEVELHGDDPEAMMALLAHIYGLSYSCPDGVSGDDPLHKQALLFVAAEKYQLSGLQEDTVGRVKGICASIYELEDFYNAVRTIFSATSPNSIARGPIVRECITNAQDWKDDDEFVSLLRSVPDLGIAIIRNSDLKYEPLGDWVCDEDSGCGGFPCCHSCWILNGSPIPFEASFLKAHRSDSSGEWLCPSCSDTIAPECSNCAGDCSWIEALHR